MFLVNFFRVVKIVRAFGVDTLVYDEVLAVLLMYQRMVTVRATKGGHFGDTVLLRRKLCVTNLTQNLSFNAIVTVKIRFGSIAERAGTVVRDVAFLTPGNWFDFYVIAVFEVRDKQTPIPFVVMKFDFREFVDFEFLVLRGV